ncbi:hypothetical protein J4461_00375 [Candidatus Pacearchaeota archaeon]|nr:hypothetical protein [Candidatus Pacearchaeota archaeon]
MQTNFKRHQIVKIITPPDPEYVEYHNEDDPNFKEVPIVKGMKGKINIILPNGQYHVEIISDSGEIIAYAPFSEESLEAI